MNTIPPSVWDSFFGRGESAPVQPAQGTRLPQPGTGTQLTANALGYSVSVNVRGQKFAHPFRPSLGAAGLRFARGLVEGLEPKIKGVPLSGDSGHGQPALPLEFKDANKDGDGGLSWAVIEVEPDEEDMLTNETPIRMVHRNTPIVSRAPNIGRIAIAQIIWRNKRPVRVFPIVHFNLRYEKFVPAPGRGSVRHLFL